MIFYIILPKNELKYIKNLSIYVSNLNFNIYEKHKIIQI